MALKHNVLKERKIGPFLLDTVDIIVLSILLLCCVVFLILRATHPFVVVQGASMVPTFQHGDVLFVDTKFSEEDIQYDTVIAFDDENGKVLIKRVIGLPGDTIQIKDGIVYRNGKALEESFARINDAGEFAEEKTIDGYFALGDNRNDSYDCRFFGAIPFEKIRYVVNNLKPILKL